MFCRVYPETMALRETRETKVTQARKVLLVSGEPKETPGLR